MSLILQYAMNQYFLLGVENMKNKYFLSLSLLILSSFSLAQTNDLSQKDINNQNEILEIEKRINSMSVDQLLERKAYVDKQLELLENETEIESEANKQENIMKIFLIFELLTKKIHL